MRGLLLLAFVAAAHADWYTYPVKSINLDAAPTPVFYTGTGAPDSIQPADDLHPVHGVQTSNGWYVMVGKALEREDDSTMEAFAVMMDADGKTVWAWRSNVVGDDAANAVVQVSDTAVAVVGWQTVNGVGRRCITQLSLETGAQQWVANALGDTTTTGAYEMVHVDGSNVYLAGLHKKASPGEMAFKSYGNVAEGVAVVQKIPLAALAAGTAPTSSDFSWTVEYPSYFTAKAARPVAGAKLAVLLYAEEKVKHAAMIVLNAADGSTADGWSGPMDYGEQQGEASDIQPSSDGLSVVFVGHGAIVPDTLPARMSKVMVADGTVAWQKSFSVGGTETMIYNECWGAVALRDGSGFAVSCGAGIEGCDMVPEADRADCAAGLGDKREGAYPRGAGVWQSYIIRTDNDGNLLWQRVDSYKAPGDPALGASGWTASSSAAEFIFQTTEGNIVAVSDEVFGVGLLKLQVETSSTSPPTPSTSPPTPSTSPPTPSTSPPTPSTSPPTPPTPETTPTPTATQPAPGPTPTPSPPTPSPPTPVTPSDTEIYLPPVEGCACTECMLTLQVMLAVVGVWVVA